MAWGVVDPHILSDPAFSSDPRSHPHVALAHAPALSSDAPRSLPHSPASSAPSTPNPPSTPASETSKQAPSQNASLPRKTTMRALVRRLTSRHNLDRIDELDETDPFGGSYHHDGPYEAIGTNHIQPTTPASRRATIHHSRREFNPRSFHRAPDQSPPRVPSIGLSLHLEPGQILQHNAIYTSHVSSITSAPSHSRRQSNALAIVPKPDHSRSHSLPNSRSRSLQDSSNQPSLFPRAPSQRFLGDDTPDIPHILPLRHDHDAAPHIPSQTDVTAFPPPRYVSRLHNSGLSSPSLKPTSPKTRATESAVPAMPPHGPRHKSVRSLDSSYTINSAIIPSSSSMQNKSPEPPRMRHLPKRLVMPAPLQPQLPQPQYKFPAAEPVVPQDEYSDDHTLEGSNFEGQPAMYTQGPRVLRKKSSAFPVKLPIPHHVPMLQNDAVPTTGNAPTKTANEVEGTKEKIRRRRLSKRKNDI